MNDDDLRDLRALRELPAPAPARALDARIRRRAHEELKRQAAVSWLTMAWTRVALPAALAVMVLGYLRWAITAASALYD
jgi:hypothetical protein